MDILVLIIGIVIGFVIGSTIVWFASRSKSTILNNQIIKLEENLNAAQESIGIEKQNNSDLNSTIVRLETTLEHEKKSAEEKLAIINKATEELRNTFKALSSDALKSNSQSFLDLAKTTLEKLQSETKADLNLNKQAVENIVKPINESLNKYNEHVHELEKTRQHAYDGLSNQIKNLMVAEEKLHSETDKLAKALQSPTVRGRWGEMQLKRVIELAGMLSHCDFEEQKSVLTDDGRLRPDVVVRLPGEKNIVVDAKTPLIAYLEAVKSDNENDKKMFLKDHARQVRNHMANLSAKSYWEQFQPTPEFVVMFLPGENFFSAALEHDPGLIEEGVNQRVILATPTTLISLLRAVAYGWRQEKIAESAQIISKLGREIYERLRILAQHFSAVGKNLNNAVESYNKAIGSLEGRVLPSARRLQELGVDSKKQISIVDPIEKTARQIQAPELNDNEEIEKPNDSS